MYAAPDILEYQLVYMSLIYMLLKIFHVFNFCGSKVPKKIL